MTAQDSATYDTMRGLNLAGFGLALGAGATTVVGLVVAAASGGPTGRVAAAPYVLPADRGAVFGIGDSW